MDAPGTYKVQARRRISIYADSKVVGTLDATSELDIEIVQGDVAELKRAFEKYTRDLTFDGFQVRFNAIAAITTAAPPFLEDHILQLSRTSYGAGPTITALASLNTPRTRKRLAEMAEDPDRPGTRQAAIGALAQTLDPSVLNILERIAKTGLPGDRSLAITNLGLFGKPGFALLSFTLRDPDVNIQIAAVRGMGATASRSAVPILIDLLRTSDRQLALDARVSLAELTHFAVDGKPFLQNPPPEEWRRWHQWWVANHATAEIFDTNHCSEPRPLP